MTQAFEYRTAVYDRANKPENETEAEGVLKLLNANGSQGWELVQFEDSTDGKSRTLWFKRPAAR